MQRGREGGGVCSTLIVVLVEDEVAEGGPNEGEKMVIQRGEIKIEEESGEKKGALIEKENSRWVYKIFNGSIVYWGYL